MSKSSVRRAVVSLAIVAPFVAIGCNSSVEPQRFESVHCAAHGFQRMNDRDGDARVLELVLHAAKFNTAGLEPGRHTLGGIGIVRVRLELHSQGQER